MSSHKAQLDLATAALLDIISHAQTMQAAVLRQAPGKELEAMRQAGHVKFDDYLNHMTDAATQVRTILD